jgi:hypothetical protein
MDEWMRLAGGEASHRQAEQRALRQADPAARTAASQRPIHTALAAALVALAAHLDPGLARARPAHIAASAVRRA